MTGSEVEPLQAPIRHRLPARLALGLVCLLPALAGADPVVVSPGKEGGSYYTIGRRLSTERVLARERPADVRTSRGSLENLALLGDPASPVNVALAQADALHMHLGRNPTHRARFFVLGDVGRECAFLVAPRDGALKALKDLRVEGIVLSVDSQASGTALTYENLVTLEPALGATRAVNVPTMEALLQLEMEGSYAALHGVLLMQRPRRSSPALARVLGDPDRYGFVPITAADLPGATLPDGSDVYSFETVSAGGKADPRHVEVETLCTRGLLLGSREKLSDELRGRLAQIMLEAGERVAGKDE